jgi:hypothetical protein
MQKVLLWSVFLKYTKNTLKNRNTGDSSISPGIIKIVWVECFLVFTASCVLIAVLY